LGNNPNFSNDGEFFDVLLSDNNQQMQAQSGNIQVGMALVNSDGPNSVWAQSMEAEGSRLWKKFFSTGNPSCLHISVPLE
jgi:hypothetical protein